MTERIDALREHVEKSFRLLRAALSIIGRVRQDDVRLRTQACKGVHEGEAVKSRVRLDVVIDRDREGRARPVRDIVHDEIPHALERLVGIAGSGVFPST